MSPTRLQARPPFPATAFWGGLLAFATLSLLFQFVDWDPRLAAHYGLATPRWPGETWGWARWLYRFGETPAVIVGALGGLAFAASFVSARFRAWRGPGLYLFVLLLLGPGLLVNGLTKALAGRPRPLETVGLGGLWEFARPFHLGPAGRGLSFLSGHCASAWYFFGFFFLLRAPWKGLSLLGTLALGAAMSLARISQGAHWLSDTLLAGAALFTLAAALSPLIHWQPSRRFWRRPGLAWALGLGALAWLSLSHVRYEDRRFITLWQKGPGRPMHMAPQQRLLTWQSVDAPTELVLDLALPASDLRVDFSGEIRGLELPLALDARFFGQGLPGSRETLQAKILQPGTPGLAVGPSTLAYGIAQELQGVWFVKQGHADLRLPRFMPVDARLQAPRGRLTIGPLPAGRRVLISRLPAGVHPPQGFQPYGGSAWLREGADPLIALDLQARDVAFE